MGNVLTQNANGTTNDNNLISNNTSLNKIIIDWAINNYSIPDGTNNKNILKKRACCTRKINVPINIAGVDGNSIKEFEVNIPIFSDQNNINTSTCSSLDDTPFSYLIQDNIVNENAKSTCKNFYNNYCKNIRDDRIKKFKNKYSDELFGPNPDDSAKGLPKNAYTDCNCENSPYKVYNSEFGGNYSPDLLAQTIDSRCANGIKNDTAWVDKYVINNVGPCNNQDYLNSIKDKAPGLTKETMDLACSLLSNNRNLVNTRNNIILQNNLAADAFANNQSLEAAAKLALDNINRSNNVASTNVYQSRDNSSKENQKLVASANKVIDTASRNAYIDDINEKIKKTYEESEEEAPVEEENSNTKLIIGVSLSIVVTILLLVLLLILILMFNKK
jgi:hypothetical protein